MLTTWRRFSLVWTLLTMLALLMIAGIARAESRSGRSWPAPLQANRNVGDSPWQNASEARERRWGWGSNYSWRSEPYGTALENYIVLRSLDQYLNANLQASDELSKHLNMALLKAVAERDPGPAGRAAVRLINAYQILALSQDAGSAWRNGDKLGSVIRLYIAIKLILDQRTRWAPRASVHLANDLYSMNCAARERLQVEEARSCASHTTHGLASPDLTGSFSRLHLVQAAAARSFDEWLARGHVDKAAVIRQALRSALAAGPQAATTVARGALLLDPKASASAIRRTPGFSGARFSTLAKQSELLRNPGGSAWIATMAKAVPQNAGVHSAAAWRSHSGAAAWGSAARRPSAAAIAHKPVPGSVYGGNSGAAWGSSSTTPRQKTSSVWPPMAKPTTGWRPVRRSAGASSDGASGAASIARRMREIRNGRHGYLPSAQASPTIPGHNGAGTLTVGNHTEYAIQILLSGPTSAQAIIPAGGSKVFHLAEGQYEISASVPGMAQILPFYGSGSYQINKRYALNLFLKRRSP